MGNKYYWLKLKDDFFDSLRIKKLRKFAGGDTYTIIYLKMQLLALKKDGILTYQGYEDDFVKELALDLDEEEENVAMTLNYLMNTGLVETSDDRNFLLPYVLENTGSETASAIRSREYRSKQKMLQGCCNATSMQQKPNVEIEIEKEIEIEIEIEKEEKEEVEEE